MTVVGRASRSAPLDDLARTRAGGPPGPARSTWPSTSGTPDDGRQGDRDQRAGQAAADLGRLRRLDSARRGGMGGPQRARRAACQGRPGAGADAVHVHQRWHRGAGRLRLRGAEARAARRGDHQLGVLAWLGGPDRPASVGEHAVRGGVRADRAGAGGADHRQRGQRRGGRQLPADRRAQERRLHPGPGGRHLPGADRAADRGRVPGRDRPWELVGAAETERRRPRSTSPGRPSRCGST